MDETGDALRSCMEQLLLVRDEKERLIIEATNKISSEHKKTLHLQQKFEDTNKQFDKVITENYNLCNTVASKEKLIKELKESKGHSEQKLTEATARLEFSQKQCASLQYEVRVLQEELEIRSKEREYDLKSIDAARKKQQESAKKIAVLEAECQRLRTMVQKRLPGPAALAKMKDEVKRQGSGAAENGTRRPRAAVQPQQPRHSSMSEGHLVKLQELGDENRQLRQLLAQKESDLHFVLSKYADEACKLSILQRQHEELSGSHGSTENNHPKPMVSAFAKPEHSISGKQQVSKVRSRSRRITGSDMQLLVDPIDIEKLEWASRPSSAPHQCLDSPDTNSKMIISDTCHRELTPVILDEVTHALKNEISAKENDGAHFSYDRAEINTIVATLIERVSSMAERFNKNNVMSFRSLSHEKPELTLRIEHLVHVCSDVLDGKANLERLTDEVCLILEWIVSRCLLCADELDIVDYITNNSDGESQRTLSIHGKDIMQSTKSKIVLGKQQERRRLVETTEDLIPDVILENHSQIELITSKLVEDLVALRQEQSDSFQEQHLVRCEAKSAASHGSKDKLAEEEGNQITTTSAISAAARKLSECQETMANLSKQLHGLESPANTDPSDKEKCAPSAEPVATEKKEHGEPDANATEKKEHEQDSGQSLQSAKSASTLLLVRPTVPKSPRPPVSVDEKKKKRRANLLGRLVFRKKA
ncbi:filament-like plant protein 7 [Sorghum bicolor]|uniref:Filament-like plant protein 7 n=1 Tax=Sorghum bicolor TaxID=4558 RepID=C5YBV0_SORBI|nr:filament-like plant protein 7 [Sorghum bicolor]EES11085.1 hypothetical protein SORBI_3006G139300 [Sorghum bicolor]OQU81909.1 hypothetical protein SORBI_3006G139300 [Sorghum bicolor]|eukprot:XP_002446757.1 filament-like plant protein 7 [Sorghum bicolor]